MMKETMTSQKIPQYNKTGDSCFGSKTIIIVFVKSYVSFIMFKFYEVTEETLQFFAILDFRIS